VKVYRGQQIQVAAIPHMTVTTFIGVVYLIYITQLNDSFQGWGGWKKKRVTLPKGRVI
jgi:hypothetical protein